MSEELSNRVQVLETKVDIMENTTVKEVKEELRALRQNQFKMFDRFSDMEGKISDFRAHTDERISNLQAHMDNRFIDVEKRFSEVQASFADVHKSMANLTRWFMATIIGVVSLAVVVIKYL